MGGTDNYATCIIIFNNTKFVNFISVSQMRSVPILSCRMTTIFVAELAVPDYSPNASQLYIDGHGGRTFHTEHLELRRPIRGTLCVAACYVDIFAQSVS